MYLTPGTEDIVGTAGTARRVGTVELAARVQFRTN
jgi:hypothetical protein